MATVTITYTKPVAQVRDGEPIVRFFGTEPSYVDSDPYEGSVYDTNVSGWGKLWGLLPLASSPIKLAYFEEAIMAAIEAEKAGQVVPSISVEVEGNNDLLWWKQMAPNLEEQGYTVSEGGGASSPVVGEGQADFAVLTE